MNGWDPNALNSHRMTPLILSIKKNQKCGVKDILKINKTFKANKSAKFDLNSVDPLTSLNVLYLLLRQNFWDLAEDVFTWGGDAWIPVFNGFK